jgi:hypothetical protein
MAVSCKYGNESAGSGATELVSYNKYQLVEGGELEDEIVN